MQIGNRGIIIKRVHGMVIFIKTCETILLRKRFCKRFFCVKKMEKVLRDFRWVLSVWESIKEIIKNFIKKIQNTIKKCLTK